MTAALPGYWPELFAARAREPLARHTSWHVGGPAEVFFEPRDAADLVALLAALPAEVPVTFIGLGSNVLVRDGGIPGVVVCTHGGLDRLERVQDTDVRAEAGVPCGRLARQCVTWQLGPADFFAGIPGTVGGALAMNAGAFGGETWPHVRQVEVVDRRGARRIRAAGEYQYGYRTLTPPAASEWFLAAWFQFAPQPAASSASIRALLDRRRDAQPIGTWSGGSTFVNPPGQHAARLIESAGLKGFRIGDAAVSDKHANFLVNDGAATSADLEALIRHIQTVVKSVHGIALETEVRILGQAA
jgi:UDP-N-acetylmuramate dehydrogenase